MIPVAKLEQSNMTVEEALAVCLKYKRTGCSFPINKLLSSSNSGRPSVKTSAFAHDVDFGSLVSIAMDFADN